MRAYFLVGLVSAIFSFAATWVAIRVAKRYRLQPEIRDRDVHSEPTPRIGGIGMFVGLLAGLAAAASFGWFDSIFSDPGPILAVVVAAAIIIVIGLLDDLLDMDWTLKLAGQIVAAAIIAWQGVQIVSIPIAGLTVGSYGVSLVVTVLVTVVVMNAVNFIDGLDGLAAGVVAIGTAAFFLYTYLLAQQTSPSNYFSIAGLLSAIVIGMTLGFLPLNWRPAKIFMGDSGSMLLGLLMSVSAIAVTGSIDPATVSSRDLIPAFLPLILPIGILLLPLLDLAFAVFRRLRRGTSPFAPDRGHIHHQLQDIGHGHRGTVLVFYHWTILISLCSLAFFFFAQPVVIALVSVWLILALLHTFWPVLKKTSSNPTKKEVTQSD